MRLYHHDARDYETAKGQMAVNIRRRFEASIEQGKLECQRVLEQIDSEVPADRIVPASAMTFMPLGDGVSISIADKQETIHDHALQQLCSRGKMNLKFARSLQEFVGEWAPELLAHNLNKLYTHGPGAHKRYLTRSVEDELRGFLSDRYRRLDCRPLLHAFHKCAIQQAGAVPVRGYALPTKVAVRVVLPTVFEPIPNQPMLYGLEWYNSDYGHGTHSLRAFIHQPWCTNEATRDDVLREFHKGGRLSEDFTYSQRTYELDQRASESALRDTVAGLLAPKNVDETMAVIKRAHEERVDPKQIPKMLKQLRKGELEQVTEAFTSADIENLSPGQNRWRLSNAISFVATQTENKYRALELERISGKVCKLATGRGEVAMA